MLILKAKEVQYCSVSHQGVPQGETLPGLSYHGHLFIKVKSYAQDQWKKAILHCRELLQLKRSPLSIIVKEPTGFTLWSEDKSLKCALNQPASKVTLGNTSTKNKKAQIKYRGVEIVREKKLMGASKIVKNSQLKYRGQSYSK